MVEEEGFYGLGKFEGGKDGNKRKKIKKNFYINIVLKKLSRK